VENTSTMGCNARETTTKIAVNVNCRHTILVLQAALTERINEDG
jgi:hypothetical protein